MLMSSLSGSVLWVGLSGIRVGSAIRVKKTRGGSDTNLLVGETTSGGSDTNCWGFLPPLRNGGVHDHCLKEAKHTDTIFNVVRQNRLHPRERVHFIRD